MSAFSPPDDQRRLGEIHQHRLNLEGIFSQLPNVAWTTLGPCECSRVPEARMEARKRGLTFEVTGVDKFPRMTDYVTLADVRIADADRVRLGAYLAPGTTVMHEGFCNFNAGTLGHCMVEGRISAGVVVGRGSDVGGGASIMGTLSGGGKERIKVGERCLIGATRHIKLGTGVISVSYHNPLWVAGRIVLLDHLTRGRAMLGLGPGSLPTDGVMIGLQQSQTRGLLEDGVAIITKLLTSDEPVTFKNDRWDLREARLHLRPYSNPVFDVAVAAVASPTGAKLAGRYGLGMLSVGATTAAGFDALALHWDVLTAEAKAHGKIADRSKWRPCWLVPHRGNQGAGLSRRRIRHRALVPLLPAGCCIPAKWRWSATWSPK